MELTLDFAPVARVRNALQKIADLDASPLATILEGVLREDNRRGVLAGLDGDGNPMTPTKYRRSSVSANPGMTAAFGELGPGYARLAVGDYGQSLSTKEYQNKSGPPLAPQGERSRVVSNYFTVHERSGDLYTVEGYWDNIFSKKGVPFLHAHFVGLHATYFGATGNGRHTVNLPRRDLVGLRAWGREEARRQIDLWARLQIALAFAAPYL
jgi:hypothetical protein